MKTIQEILDLSIAFLQKKGMANPKREAGFIIADALNLPLMELFLQHERPLQQEELDRCRSFLLRRIDGEPLQYIRGQVEFSGCEIRVDRRVLIPRQETEILVEMIRKEVHSGVLLDLCCGSGYIAIALKKAHPNLQVFASDLSPDALQVAKENAERNQVDITFLQGDLLAPFSGKKADWIVCNPPYISEEEYHNLDREVKDFEPRSALVGGVSGLEFYERLAKELPNFLYPHGKVWFEIGFSQGEAVSELFQDSCWKKAQLLKDWSGKDRFFFLEIE